MEAPTTSDSASLVKGVVSDVGKLLDQQFQLLRSEFSQELDKARGAVVSMGAGAGLVGAGALLGTLMAVHLLHEKTRLPLWGCYGLVGGLLGVAGAGLVGTGAAKAAQVHLVPPQTAETLRQDADALKRVVSEAGA
jgi:hypothetical protein